MNTQSIEKTAVGLKENFEVVYERRTFLGIISWYVNKCHWDCACDCHIVGKLIYEKTN